MLAGWLVRVAVVRGSWRQQGAAVVVVLGGGVAGCGWGGDEDYGDGVHGSRVVMMMYTWWFRWGVNSDCGGG
nr:hypothetical protein [Tanacetum cinerariifolium]GFC28688.1 hypothetical protein [Tanacetum cinerariifolium]